MKQLHTHIIFEIVLTLFIWGVFSFIFAEANPMNYDEVWRMLMVLSWMAGHLFHLIIDETYNA